MTNSITLAPRRHRTKAIRAVVAAGLVLSSAACAVSGGDSASDGKGFPTQAVELTVPSDPGGSTDLIGRAFARSAEKSLGESVAVVNKTGANGKVGGKDVIGSKADGYKVVVMPQSLYAIGPLVQDDASAIKLDDMTILSGLTVEDYVLVVPAKSEYKTLKDLLAEKDLKYGTTGAGTGSQLAQALLFGDAGVKAIDVPFDGGGPLITALLGSQVDAGTTQVAESAQQIKSGKLRPLAVFSAERLDSMPNVPTAKEAGFDVVVDQRRYLAAPKGLPANVSAKLRETVTEATKDSAYAKFLKANYIRSWVVDANAAKDQLDESKATYAALARKFSIDLKSAS